MKVGMGEEEELRHRKRQLLHSTRVLYSLLIDPQLV